MPSFYMMVIIIPSLKRRGEDQMSWVRASTILSMCDAQSIGGGRCSRKAGGSCSRKAGGRYMDHSGVCDADLPLNMSPTVCSALLGGPQEGCSSSSRHTGHAAQQGKFRGDLLSHWPPGLGAFVLFMERATALTPENM